MKLLFPLLMPLLRGASMAQSVPSPKTTEVMVRLTAREDQTEEVNSHAR
jgi:hypothetical protein